jgi:hypothetical protein
MRYAPAVLAIAAGLALAACGHAPPKPPPPAELPVDAAAALDGTWVRSDAMDWSYRLMIAAPTVKLHTDRAKLGRCDQRGELTKTGDRQFSLRIAFDSCKPDQQGGTVLLHVDSYTGPVLDLAVGAEHWHFTRAPSNEP